jgi:cobalt/nickel transport system permease protein
MMLTPLGILAGGTAWGEWTARDFSNPKIRKEIAAASGNVAPPVDPPRGLLRYGNLWKVAIPQYAPPFIRHPAVGYALSAMFGSGAIILVSVAAGSLATRARGKGES